MDGVGFRSMVYLFKLKQIVTIIASTKMKKTLFMRPFMIRIFIEVLVEILTMKAAVLLMCVIPAVVTIVMMILTVKEVDMSLVEVNLLMLDLCYQHFVVDVKNAFSEKVSRK